MQLEKIIERHWYVKSNKLLVIILIIPTMVFWLVSRLRFYLYQFSILKSYKLSVPLVVVGNINVGGVGKTPLTKMLALQLQACGKNVGIILRGYKSQNKSPRIVTADSDSFDVGDEALIYALNGLKVAIGTNRYQAGLALLEHYPETDIILADDGLQHYRLQRDFEIAVVDGKRLFGNYAVLPMGPLRETISRLQTVNAIVINGNIKNTKQFHHYKDKLYYQQIKLDKIYNPILKQIVDPDFFCGKHVTAMAAIGNPGRFFELLHNIGLKPTQQLIYPDHHHYRLEDIPKNTLILVTEKDYTKLSKFNNPNIYMVLITASLNGNSLINQILELN